MSEKIIGLVKKLLIVVAGNALYAAAVTFFIVPDKLVLGGFTGLSIAISHFININVSYAVLLFHSAAFIAGTFVLGKSFAVSTAASTFLYPLLLNVMERSADKLTLPQINNVFINAILSALLIGISLGMLTRNNTSTGGTEVIPLIINKLTGRSVGGILLVIDGMIMLLGLAYSDWIKVIYGIIIVLIYSAIVHFMNLRHRDETISKTNLHKEL